MNTGGGHIPEGLRLSNTLNNNVFGFNISENNSVNISVFFFFNILLTVHLSIILVINQLNAQNLVL